MALIAASALALAAGDADAQRMVAGGAGASYAPMPGGSRWGSKVDGRWWAGANAPGGWRAYRRPVRGRTLPGYWIQPGFAIADWSSYGLGAPPAGYGWSRYYDDAVLIDGRGRVYDNVAGVDWDAGGYGSYYSYSYEGYDEAGRVQPTYGQSTYPPAYAPAYTPSPYAATAGYPAPPPAYVERRGSGVGGAVIGGVVGGVAGNRIAGRGNRLEGTLIGAGVGGAAGYAIDRSSTRRVPVAPQPYGGPGYAPAPVYPAPVYAPPPPPPPLPRPPVWQSSGGGTTVTTTSVGGYPGVSTTVVTVQTAPVITTTTTEIVEDHVTWSRPRVVRHKWVRRPVCTCG